MRWYFIVSLVALLGQQQTSFADWPQFRGLNASSIDRNSDPPTEFGSNGKNIAWKVPLPGKGVGGPIVVENQVIATSSGGLDERRISVTSVDQSTGKVKWQQQLVARGRPYCHPTSANAAPTPASDGKYVFAFYSSNDLACIDLQGRLIWYRAVAVDFPKAGNDVGMSSSPLVIDDVVVVQIECQADSFVAGIDASTGETLWRVSRPRQANWSSPVIAKTADGKSLIVVQSAKGIDGIVPRTGTVAWTLPIACSIIPSSTFSGNRLLVPSKGLTALELGSADQPPKATWDNNKLSPSNASPLVDGENVYCVNRSILVRGNVGSGELDWQLRLPDAGTVWATPVMGKEHLYQFAEDGKCFVIDVQAPQGKIVATNELGEKVLGSPALSGDAIYVRGAGSLYKIARN